MTIVDEAGGEIAVEDLCAELRRRGWAFDNLSPAAIGISPGSIIARRDTDIELCPLCLGKGELLTPEGAMHWCGMCAGTGDLDD